MKAKGFIIEIKIWDKYGAQNGIISPIFHNALSYNVHTEISDEECKSLFDYMIKGIPEILTAQVTSGMLSNLSTHEMEEEGEE